MKPKRILVPIDIARCPLEVFDRVNAFAGRPGVTVILLHVVTLNIAAADNRVFEELGREAGWYLERLARKHVHPDASTLIHVRTGKAADEILAEARAEDVDLIILPTFGGSLWKRGVSFWKRLFAPIFPGMIVEKLARNAPCALLFMHAESRFNCEEKWGRPGNETDAASDHLDGALESRTSPVLRTEDAWGFVHEQHRAAA
jgi:nucleotide-binding universal stress UspA family protein